MNFSATSCRDLSEGNKGFILLVLFISTAACGFAFFKSFRLIRRMKKQIDSLKNEEGSKIMHVLDEMNSDSRLTISEANCK